MRVLPDLLDLVLPASCVSCGRPGPLWCPGCRPASNPEPVSLPAVGGHPAVFAAGDYGGALRSALLAFKERGRRALVGPLAAYLSDAVDVSCQLLGELPLLVPIPSDRAAARQRGGDHLLRLAAEVGPQNGLQVLPVLRLAGRGRDSAGLSAAQRAANLAHRMRAVPAPPAGRPVLIVDDIVTTGATLAEATRALQEAGWQVAGAAVIAATRLRRPERWPPASTEHRPPLTERRPPASTEHRGQPSATRQRHVLTGQMPGEGLAFV